MTKGMLRAAAVATHAEGTLEALRASAARAGVELDVLGWGEPWRGHAHTKRLLRAWLEKAADDVVLLVDGFDVVFVPWATRATLLERFLTFGTDVVLSADGASGILLQDALQRRIFGRCLGAHINSGVIMGRARAVRELLDRAFSGGESHDDLNDQRVLAAACRADEPWFRAHVAVDTEMRLAATSTCAFAPRHQFARTLANGALIAHGAGACDMNDLLAAWGFPAQQLRPRYLWASVWKYAPFVWKEALAAAVLLLWVLVYVVAGFKSFLAMQAAVHAAPYTLKF